MSSITLILLFLVPMSATAAITMLVCRYRLSHRREVSWGTVFSAACCVPTALTILVTFMSPDIWSREGKNVPEIWLAILAFLTAMCVMPALLVAAYYQRLSRRDETRKG